MNENPFYKKSTYVPFPQIKTEHYIPALKEGIERAKKNIAAIKSNPEKPSFENTIVALETASEFLDEVVNIYFVLFSAEAPKDHQALAPEISALSSAFSSDVSLDEDLFKRIKVVYDTCDKSKLSAEQQMLLEKTYKSFVRNGALLDEAKKTRMRSIDQELSALGPKFSENVLNATNEYLLVIDNKSELKGLPESALVAAQELAESKGKPGKWAFNLQAPSFVPALNYLDSEKLREELSTAYGKRCYNDKYDNQEVILSMLRLKSERAKILGFENHAAYVLEERMAQTADKVTGFLERLLKYSLPAAQKEIKELEQEKKSLGLSGEIKPWDVRYLQEKVKKRKFDFDEEELKPYFELESVYKGAFEMVRKLYGIKFVPVDNVPLYHPDVKTLEVREEADNSYIGLLYMDFFPRDTKKGGAWMTDVRRQGLSNGKIERPQVSIVMNFTKPTKTDPSLLTFDEVLTFFHEFGHALHGLLSKCTYQSLAGASVYWDFVELPSQFMENWILERPVLDLFAKHYKTGQPLPEDLYKKLKDSSKFMAGYDSLRQLSFGLLDMAWYTVDPTQITDVNTFEKKATERTRLLAPIPGVNQSVSFSHIFAGGYSAGYYSYKWAEVLDADAFEHFKNNGLFSQDIAKKFRTHILEKGGTEHPMELYKRFKGGEPDPDALLRRDGLI